MRKILAALLLALMPLQAFASSLDIIVLRGEDTIEVFFSAPTRGYIDLFGMSPSMLEEPDGTVDFDALREGTFDMADDIFASVDTWFAGAPVFFEAMSMMVHPIDDRLQFRTPVDGMVAMAVCTVPTPDIPPALDTLWAYSGFITYVDDPSGPVSLELTAMTLPSVEVSVRYFTEEGFVGRETFTHAAGTTLLLGNPSSAVPLWVLWLIIVGLALGAGVITYRVVMTRIWRAPQIT